MPKEIYGYNYYNFFSFKILQRKNLFTYLLTSKRYNNIILTCGNKKKNLKTRVRRKKFKKGALK